MSRSFVPAAGYDLFLPLYDPLWKLVGADRVHAAFVRDAGIVSGQRVLDVGCGTGSLAVRIAGVIPDVDVIGLDPDAKALARAARKAGRAGVDVTWRQGFADALPYADGACDRVLSSFMFHHLDPGTKRGMLAEVRRVLRPDGELHLIDFAPKSGAKQGLLARLLHSHEHLADQRDDSLAALLAQAGFAAVREISRQRNVFGSFAHVGGVARPA